MQSSQHWQRYHTSSALNGSEARGVLVQGEMRPEFVVVDRIRAEHLAQVRFAEYDEVIQSLPANRADQPFDMSVLPRGTECSPRTDAQLRDLIRRTVTENRWGAPRIHGELVKLGFRVSERTVSRYVRASRPRRPPGPSWKTFLDDHRDVLAAMDFFTVPTLTLRLLYVLLVIEHGRRCPGSTCSAWHRTWTAWSPDGLPILDSRYRLDLVD